MKRLSQSLGSRQLGLTPPCAHLSDANASSHALHTLLRAWDSPGPAHPQQRGAGGEDGGMEKADDHSDQVWAGKGGTKGMATDGRQALTSCLLSTP